MAVKHGGSAIECANTKRWRDYVMGALGLEGCKRLGALYGSGTVPLRPPRQRVKYKAGTHWTRRRKKR